MRTLAAAVMLVALASSARAGDPDVPDLDDKSMGVAMGLSLGGTLGGLALATGGILADGAPHDLRVGMFAVGGTAALVMPTAGHWYARGSTQDGTVGSYLRLGGGALVMIGGVALATGEHEEDAPGDHSADIELGIVYAGLATMAAGAIVDIATTPAEVHRANRRRHSIDLSISPTPSGFVVSGRF